MSKNEYIKVVFLDIDGVLNSECSVYENYEKFNHDPSHTDMPCPAAVANLNIILDSDPNIRIVLSSTWRILGFFGYVEKILILSGMRPGLMFDETPRRPGEPRGFEIQQWLCAYEQRFRRSDEPRRLDEKVYHGPIESFVILDDDSDMAQLSGHHVHIDGTWGLTKEDANLALEVLGGRTLS